MQLIDDLQAMLVSMDGLKEPETIEEQVAQLALIGEAVNTCEKLLMYFATSPSGREEMLTYLFEYKQLLNLQERISRMNFPHQSIQATPQIAIDKPWWKFW